MSEPLRLPHNSKASQNYKKRHNIDQPKKQHKKKPNNNRKKFNNKNKNTKNKNTKKELQISREEIEAPKSFIIIRGRVTKYCKFLRDDLRLIFSPYTAAKLREKQSNSLKDFIVSSTEFGVTHLITLSQSDIAGTMLRMIRLPKGPTFWFQIKQYSLIQDIVKMQHKSHSNYNNKKWHHMKQNKTASFLPGHIQFAFRFAPLVILNGFSAATQTNNKKNFNRATLYHKQLMSVMFKHMFCPINVISMKLTQCKRVVFLNYDSVNDSIQLRHYKIQIANDLKGISKGIKKIIRGNKYLKKSKDKDKYPDLSQYSDIQDYVIDNKEEYLSDSEVEDDENTKVILAKINKMNKNQSGSNLSSSFVRLREIGPRIDMELVKIEELINDGKVLYHRYINKTREEIEQLQMNKDLEKELKNKRKIKQMFNVQKKQDLKKEKANKRIENRKQKEVEKLLKSFEIDKNEKNNERKVGEKKGILKNKKRNNSNSNSGGPSRKKRKLNKKRVKFDT